MSPDLLKYYLQLKQQMLCLKEEKIVRHYQDPNDFFEFFYQLCFFTEFDDFLFSEGRGLIDKCYSTLQLYRDQHREDPETYNSCNQTIIQLNEAFLNLNSSLYDQAKKDYVERMCAIRGLDDIRSRRMTTARLREYMEDDFNIFEVIDQCVHGEFDDEESSFCELPPLERLHKLPLKDLAVTGYSDQDTYDYIVGDSFLSTVNYLLGNCYYFLEEEGKDHLSVISELTDKALEERRKMQENPALREGVQMPMDDYYLTWSEQTRARIVVFQKLFFPDPSSRTSKMEKTPFQKISNFFSRSKKE